MTKMVRYFLLAPLLLAGCGQGQEFSLAPASAGFQQSITYNSTVDVLWVIDNSQSMGQHQADLGNQFGYFIDGLNQTKLDYHIGVMSTDAGTDQGRLLGASKYLTSSDSDVKGKFKTMAALGTTGSPVERGMQSAFLGLSDNMLNSVNSGFIRPGALLVMVYLSDEDDHSVITTTDFEARMDQLKPPYASGQKAWVSHYIGSLTTNSSCTAFGSSAGSKYMALADYTGGVKEDICTPDFSQALNNIKRQVLELVTQYHLDRDPVLDSIRVYIDGLLVPNNAINGWTYIAQGRTIQFHGTAIPKADQGVHIDFQPASIR